MTQKRMAREEGLPSRASHRAFCSTDQQFGREAVLKLLQEVQQGGVSPETAAMRLRNVSMERLEAGAAHVDHHRALRTGLPEVVYGEGKTPLQIAEIGKALSRHSEEGIIVTRITPEAYEAIAALDPPGLRYYPEARVCTIGGQEGPSEAMRARWHGPLLVATAGTCDLPIAEEAAVIASLFGMEVERLWDVGVAGIHRLLSKQDVLARARCIIVVAGMDGALPSVVAGLVDVPVIAVPTSVGYGASFGGVSAMLTMLNSCATGVAVVNIDNGFGAATLAAKCLMVRE